MSPAAAQPGRRLQRDDLARIHDVLRVERALDRAPWRRAPAAPCSASRYFILPCPTPCSPVQVPSMASARSTSRSLKRLGALDLVGIVHVDQQREVEIAVADMADDRRQQPALGDVALRLGDAFGQPRDRHADVGRRSCCAPGRSAKFDIAAWWRASHSRVRSSGSRGPVERPAAEFGRDLAEALGLLGDAGLGAVEFEEQHRRLRQAELGIDVDRPHLQRVEQFDARDRNAGLDGQDGGVAAGLDRRKRADCRRRSLPECRRA